jgi:DNA-binding transcriptional LysR family regulator
MDIELRHLRHARALAEHRHFGRAARALGLTQPALSRSIAQLERQVGARLFDRSTAGIEPTDMGHLLLDRALDVLTRSEDLGQELDSLQGRGAGVLRIGAGTYPADVLVGDALAALVEQRPDVQVRVVVENVANLVPLLRRRELDLVIGDATLFADDPEFLITPLAARQGYFVCRPGHPLLTAANPTLGDVVAFPLVATGRLTPRLLGPLVAASRRRHGGIDTRSAPTITCESLAMMKAIVAGSDAIALLPLGAVSREARSGLLAVLPLVEPWLHGNFAILRLARRTPPPASELFVQLALRTDGQLSRITEEVHGICFPARRGKRRRS